MGEDDYRECIRAIRERASQDIAKANAHSDEMAAEIARLRAELAAERATVARFRKSLEFYANPQIYNPHPHGPAFNDRDLSYSASAALADPAP